MPKLTRARLQAVMPKAPPGWRGPLNAAMKEWDIDSPERVAAFLAQVAHESSELRRLEENLNYSAARLRAVWPKRFPDDATATRYANDPERLANYVYAGRMGNGDAASGDGWKFRGRGLIQLTGRSNYVACKAALGLDVVRSPDLLREPLPAARSAGWFWKSRGLNELADADPEDDDEEDFVAITSLINGGRTGLADRIAYWRKAKRSLGLA
jgi:putative chitinase